MTRPKSDRWKGDEPAFLREYLAKWVKAGARYRRPRQRRIVLACGALTLSCDALVFGDWAAHESPHLVGLDRWRVTHVPSGCDISPAADGLSRLLAIKIARALGRNMPRLPYRTLQPGPRKPPDPLCYIAQAIIAEALAETAAVRLAGDRARRSTR